MELDHLSYSSITKFLECPENWRRKYILKEPTKTSPALIFGSAFHGAIENFLKEKLFVEQKEITDEAKSVYRDGTMLRSIWTEEWNKQIEQPGIWWGMDTPEQHYNEGVRILSNKAVADAIVNIKPGVDDQGAKIERKVELRVPGVLVPVIGFIDLILEDGTPADLKTSKVSWSEAKAADSLQGLFYLAALNQMGIAHTWKFTHMVFVKTKEPKVQILENSHKPSELFFLFEIIKRVWDSIDKGIYPINPTGWLCSESYCDFYANCRGKYA